MTKFVPSSNHWRLTPGFYKERVTRKQLQHVLLNCADPIVNGNLYEWASKHIGAGIYDLFIKEKK